MWNKYFWQLYLTWFAKTGKVSLLITWCQRSQTLLNLGRDNNIQVLRVEEEEEEEEEEGKQKREKKMGDVREMVGLY